MTNRDRGEAEKGSRYCLQKAVRDAEGALNDIIVSSSPSLLLFDPVKIDWVSPRKDRDYLEHRDEFLSELGLGQHEARLRQFWPKGGPQWDGLAKFETADRTVGYLLVEAKSHPEEMFSDCSASSPESLRTIESALAKVRAHMGVGGGEWMTRYYQLANRLAYLYFLNEEAKVPTWLALINFVDDCSYRSTSLQVWRSHYAQVFRALGLKDRAPLLERLILAYPKGL